MDMVALSFKLLHRRQDLARVIELVTPAWEALRPALPELVPLIKSIQADLFPSPASAAPLVLWDTYWLQRSLNRLGAKLTVDGRYGRATADAVKVFQINNGLPVDSIANEATCARLALEVGKLN